MNYFHINVMNVNAHCTTNDDVTL